METASVSSWKAEAVEWPFIKVDEKPLLASSKGDRFSYAAILKKNAFNHRLFMEKIPIKE